MRCLALLLIIISIFAVVSSSDESNNATCSPWLGACQVYEDCCRNLVCLTYAFRCVPKGGVTIPGEDTRPIGDGPFPPEGPTR